MNADIPTPECDADCCNLKAAFTGPEFTVGDSVFVRAHIARSLERRLAVAMEALGSIAECWNGDANDTTLHDAVQHNCEKSANALAQIAKMKGTM